MFDKTTLTAIQADIQAALKAVAEKHNLSMSGTKISYTERDFKLTCNFGDKAATGGFAIDPVALRNLQRNGFMYGLKAEQAGKEFEVPGKGTCILHGLRGKNALYEIKATSKRWLGDARMIAAFVNAK